MQLGKYYFFISLSNDAMKRILLTVLAITMLFSVGGCSKKPYAGERADLYTVALNSLLWVSGVSWEGDKETDPIIEILEEDSHGRVLFTYREKNFGRMLCRNRFTLTVAGATNQQSAEMFSRSVCSANKRYKKTPPNTPILPLKFFGA